MFSDPQSITIDSVAISCPRVRIGDEQATYRSADGTTQLRISHQNSKSRVRRMCRVDTTKIAADPLTAVNQTATAGVYLVIDAPANGVFSATELMKLITGLVEYLSTGTYANCVKMLGGES